MRARHVLGDGRVPAPNGRARVAGDPLAAMEHLDGGLRGPRLDHLADQPGRHGVEVPVDLDVIIRRDAGAPPFGILVGLGRQRHQGRPVDGLEELPAAGAELAHQPGVEFIDQLADRHVQLGQREEAPVAQPRQDQALDDQHGDLDLGLVARLARPRRQDGRAVMGGEVLVGAVDARLVAAGGRDPGLEIVADDRLRHAAEEGKRVDVSADPVRQPLAPAGLGIGVVRGPQHRDEDLGLAHLPGDRVEHRHGVAGEVHEQLLAGDMGLAHGRRDAAAPFAVEVAEPAVAVAVGMLAAIFLPQQHQRHAAAAQLGMDVGPVRQRLRLRRVVARRREQLALQRRIVELVRDRPGDADHRRAPEILPDRRAADPQRLSDHPLARPAGIPQAQNFSNLAHRQSLGGHRASPAGRKGSDLASLRLPTTDPDSPHQQGGRLRSESVAALDRNGWPPSVGITGRFASDSACEHRTLNSDVNPPSAHHGWPAWLGIRGRLPSE